MIKVYVASTPPPKKWGAILWEEDVKEQLHLRLAASCFYTPYVVADGDCGRVFQVVADNCSRMFTNILVVNFKEDGALQEPETRQWEWFHVSEAGQVDLYLPK